MFDPFRNNGDDELLTNMSSPVLKLLWCSWPESFGTKVGMFASAQASHRSHDTECSVSTNDTGKK